MKKPARDFHPKKSKYFYGKQRINVNIVRDYKWEILYNTELRRANEQIIRNRPGPSNEAKNAKTIEDLFAEIVTNDMKNNITSFTNIKIQFMTAQQPSWNDSDKYSHVKQLLVKRFELYLD